MRVHELAKELNITSKELIETVNEKLNLALKSHSSTVSEANVDKIKALYQKSSKPSAKPKAFVVKKQKVAETAETVEEKKVEQPQMKTVSRLEIVRPAPKQVQNRAAKVEAKKPQQPIEKKPQEKLARRENSTDRLSTLPSMTRRNFAKPAEKPQEKSQETDKKKDFKSNTINQTFTEYLLSSTTLDAINMKRQ